MEIILLLIIIALALAFTLNKHKIKGVLGESRVSNQLLGLPSEEYRIFNDVLIKTSKGSSQIDHVVVSVYGIFVIETKNYTGWIFGNEDSEYWTQTIYRRKTKFRNPIKQNWAHIYALREVLSEFKKATYHPIVVFAGTAELKNITATVPVIYASELLQTIYERKESPTLPIQEVNDIADKLNGINIHDNEEKRAHVRWAKKQAYEREQKEKSLICPKCGAELVVREGRYGRFYGCKNYPNCTHTSRYKT